FRSSAILTLPDQSTTAVRKKLLTLNCSPLRIVPIPMALSLQLELTNMRVSLGRSFMTHRLRQATMVFTCLMCVWASATVSAADFPLKDGDVWVMAGDSITAQHLHSNYFEAFCFARYPKLKFAFRNSGVGGHTIPTTLARFDYDIA